MALFGNRKLFTLKTLWILVNIVFTAFLTVQLAHIFERYVRPQTTRTWEEKVPLKDLDFPLVLKICVIPGFNQTALQEVGYRDTFSYFVELETVTVMKIFMDGLGIWRIHRCLELLRKCLQK